ncbi:hypothetical protein K1719_006013 [Acacia pycnantha]|nr:hypothetical protein K1719_006013 [Acacia pycnantha]
MELELDSIELGYGTMTSLEYFHHTKKVNQALKFWVSLIISLPIPNSMLPNGEFSFTYIKESYVRLNEFFIRPPDHKIPKPQYLRRLSNPAIIADSSSLRRRRRCWHLFADSSSLTSRRLLPTSPAPSTSVAVAYQGCVRSP